LSPISRRAMIVLAMLMILFVAGRLRYSGTASMKLPAADCNADLWKRLYSPGSLKVIEPCTAETGRVDSVRRESDGDLHIALDPDHKSVLNLVNAIHAHGDLVVEVICEHPSAHSDVIAACSGFTQPVTIPKVGDRVRVTGVYVTDRDNSWNEIHPVTSIETLGP
jgi:hypothetical protein